MGYRRGDGSFGGGGVGIDCADGARREGELEMNVLQDHADQPAHALGKHIFDTGVNSAAGELGGASDRDLEVGEAGGYGFR